VPRPVRSALAAAGAACLLAACVSQPRVTPGAEAEPLAPWAARRAELQSVAAFALRGRVAVAASGQGFNANVRWEQSGERALIALDGPFGAGGLRVALDGADFALTTSRGERLDGPAARDALERQLGFALPVQSMRYWLLGVPVPGQPADERLDDRLGRLSGLAQDGWQVEYPDYAQTADGPRPRRLTATRGDARMRLVVESWSPPTASPER
jgi:outer membrane lipoprotein LolB